MSDLGPNAGNTPSTSTSSAPAAPSTDTSLSSSGKNDLVTISRAELDAMHAREKKNEALLSGLVAKDTYNEVAKYIDTFVKDKFDGSFNTQAEIKELSDYLSGPNGPLRALTPEQKLAFFDHYLANSERKADLSYEMGPKELFDMKMKIVGDGPEASAQRASLIAGRFDDASMKEKLDILKTCSPEDIKNINAAYAATHGDVTLSDRIEKLAVSTGGRSGGITQAQKAELLSLMETTQEGKDAVRLHAYAGNEQEVNKILARYTPETIQGLEDTFQKRYGVDMQRYLVRHAASDAASTKVDEKIAGLESAAEAKAEEDAAPAEEVKPKEAELTPEEEVAKRQAERNAKVEPPTPGGAAPGGAAPSAAAEPTVQEVQGSYELHLNERLLKEAKPGSLMEVVRDFEKARLENDMAKIAEIKMRLGMLASTEEGKAALKEWYRTARDDWHPEKEIGGKYTPEKRAAIYSHRYELHLDLIDLISDPVNFDASRTLLSKEGVTAEAYFARKKELLKVADSKMQDDSTMAEQAAA